MIKSKLELLIDALETGKLRYKEKPVGFHMGYYRYRLAAIDHRREHHKISDDMGKRTDEREKGCGTVACIAGHAHILAENDVEFIRALQEHLGVAGAEMFMMDSFRVAKRWLGMPDSEAENLFIPKNFQFPDVTRQQAIDTCKRLLETGEVSWT